MASVLLSALTGTGAARHLVGVAEALASRGHRLTVVTTADSLDRFRHLGAELHAVPEPPMPELLQTLPPMLQRARQLLVRVQRNVIEPLPEQGAVVRRVVETAGIDVVVTDGLFLGASMLSMVPRSERPAVLMLGFFAPWIPDPLVPPYGWGVAPADGTASRVRAAALELLASPAHRVLSRSFNTAVERTFGVPRSGDLRASPADGDVWAQLTVPRFEYPRQALPPNFRFVGPLHPGPADALPDWWDPLREPPVVVVRTSGAPGIGDLVLPTIEAFGGGPDTVIVAGVPRHVVEAARPGSLPDNVHFESEPPWARLRPRSTVVVSDGDYVHSQYALRNGIPLVVSGTLETEVETGARVAWSGAGVHLRRRRPDPSEIRAAVQRIRDDDAYGTAAARIAAQIATTDAESELCDIVEQLAAV